MKFFPSKAEKEHIAVCTDDAMIASRDPETIMLLLVKDPCFKLKGTGPTKFHLGCDFYRDEEGALCYAPKKHIATILDNYQRIHGKWPKMVHSPLTSNDHPELDTSDPLSMDDQKICQSLIGALQWVIQIDQFDISTAVKTLSHFCAMPRQGHLDCVKRTHGCLSKMRHATIKIRTDAPDYLAIPVKMHDWECTCHVDAEEEIPLDSPKLKGKSVMMTSFSDANLHNDRISGEAVTCILHMFNPPIDWHSKLQSTVETATFGSECVTARTCTEQIIDLRLTLEYLGVPINGRSLAFGDNESVINSAAIPHSKMHKRWVALSHHRVRWAVAAGVINIYCVTLLVRKTWLMF